MIFVSIGTHPGQFDRLLRKIDSLALQLKEEIIIQRGFTRYVPKHCKSFTFTDNIGEYYQKARLVIVQSGTSLLEFALKYKKPVITVPRQKKYGEHLNDHQVEFGEYFSKKTGISCITDISDLTVEFLKTYSTIPIIDETNLIHFRKRLQQVFKKISKEVALKKPYARNRIQYILNLIEPQRTDSVLNIGVSNIPEIEMLLEDNVRNCITIDFDVKKIRIAQSYVKKAKFIRGDITSYQGFKHNSFDTVVALEVLEHIKEDEQVVKWVNSLLKTGGSFILSVPNNAWIHIINPVKYAEHERHYSIKRITDLLTRNGFSVTHQNTVERWTLIFNVYAHLLFKFVLRRTVPFGILSRLADNSYRQKNNRGLDIVIKAKKLP
jgi:UDP-N-acetylglucosamine transferase subunit ALG13